VTRPVTRHRLDPAPGTTNDVYSRDHAPVLTVDPGDEVVVGSLDASGHLERQRVPGEPRPRLFPQARGHALTGPVAVRGARPGQMLGVTFVDLRPGEWGWTVAGGRETPVTTRLGLADVPPAWLLWEIDADAGVATESRGLTVPTSPFLGVTGVAPAEPGEHSTTPPRTTAGGNVDCRELVAGSTLWLPVQVDDALLYLGDGHAAQGDGEVGGTAIECPMTTEVRIDLVDERPLPSVHAATPAGRITFGFDADLDVATGDALDAMVTWLAALLDVDRATALAFASAVVDLRVTQVANQTWGVHALLPTGALGL
jgi:acetamidase/formamidase